MPRHYQNKAAKCPYYRGEDYKPSSGGATLYCSGIANAETIRLYFRSKAKLQEHRRYCMGDWENCAIAQLLKNNQGEPE